VNDHFEGCHVRTACEQDRGSTPVPELSPQGHS